MESGSAIRLGIVIIFFTIILLPLNVTAAPSSYIREEATARYFANGTRDGNVSNIGYVEVDVESNVDVLQAIRLQLSNISGTNLGSDIAYKNVAASPFTADRTRMYVNTTDNYQSLVYNITDPNIAAIISLRLDYQNSAGGSDMYAGGTNAFNFNLTMSTTRDVYNVITNLRFSRDTLGQNDSINLYNPSPVGPTQVIDSDWDGFYDIVRWTGNLLAGTNVSFTFQGDIIPDVNFDESLLMLDLDREAQSTATSSQDSTLTGITFIDRFSRGPVRQGIEMIQVGNWRVRGFIKNVATSLDYITHGWELYRIGDPTPVASSSTGAYLSQGDQTFTDWYDTGVSSKQDYYASAFDWEVVWGTSQYSGLTEGRIYLPTLYAVDSFVDKTVNLNSNTQSGRAVGVTDLVRHLGHVSLNVSNISIMSRIPGNAVTGEGTSWSVTSVQVIYSNNTGQYDITSNANIVVQNAAPGSDGYVMVNVTDIQSILGHPLGQNEDILLLYDISGPSGPTTLDYLFEVQGTLFTESGTPITKNANQTLTIPGIYTPPPPGGGAPGYPPPPLYATIEKEISEVRFITEEYVEINVTDRIIDTGDKGIKDIKAMIYIPFDGSLDTDEVYLSIYDSSIGRLMRWEKDVDFTITNTGIKTIGDKKYTEYVIEKKGTGVPYEETLTLYNGDKIKIDFRAKIPVGTNYILTRVFGYNYYEDKLIFEDVYTPVRREGIISRFEITEGLWIQEKAIVGKPVVWKKEIDIYNPNNMTVEEVVSTEVFKDVISVYLLEYGDGVPKRTRLKLKSDGDFTFVDWIAKVNDFETRIFAIEVTTPPVLETREILDVLESNETTVTFSMNITLVNFALEDYFNVSFFMHIKEDDIISIQDEEGNPVSFVGNEDGIEIVTDVFKANETKNIYVLYEQTPPVIIATLEKLNYGCPDYIDGYVFVIPGEREKGAYLEMEVLGPDPELKTIYADLILLEELREFEEKKVPIRFDSSSLGSGRYLIYTKFKKDFNTLLYHQRDFVIDCPEREIIKISWIVFAAIAVAVVLLLLFRIYRKKTYKKEIHELKKKIKKI